MNRTVKLGMRMANNGTNNPTQTHPVYQLQIPIALIRRLKWRKGQRIDIRLSSMRNGLKLSNEKTK